jgi:hypothetical protein
MAGLVPAIHVFLFLAWEEGVDAGTRPGMTNSGIDVFQVSGYPYIDIGISR